MLSVRNSVSSEKKPKQPSEFEAMKKQREAEGETSPGGEDSAYESGGDARRLA